MKGNWIRSKMQPLEWKQRQQVSKQVWTSSIDLGVLMTYVDAAIGSIVSAATQSQLRCMYAPTLSFMQIAACSCGVNLSPECGFASSSSVATVDLGSTPVSCGQASTIRTGGMTVSVSAGSIQDCSRPVEIKLEKAMTKAQMSRSRSETPKKRSVIHLEKRLTTATAACYVSVVNVNNAFIGQIRGDCLVFKPSIAMAGIELCLPLKDAIPYDATTYPISGIAIATKNDDGTTIYTASNLVPSVFGSTFCVTVGTPGTYCPGTTFENVIHSL
jgi:hypothetical protein